MLNAVTNVCFRGQSGHGADLSVCPLMTQSGHSAFPSRLALPVFCPLSCRQPMTQSGKSLSCHIASDPTVAYPQRSNWRVWVRNKPLPSVSTASVGALPPTPSAISCSEVTSPSSGLSFATASKRGTTSASRMWTMPAYPFVFFRMGRAWSGRPSARSLKSWVGSAIHPASNTTSQYTELVQQA
jgi:hypothetical protein